ncbi:hypothetical protein Droror1_Dr00017500 [Drosera rotundifolia]
MELLMVKDRGWGGVEEDEVGKQGTHNNRRWPGSGRRSRGCWTGKEIYGGSVDSIFVADKDVKRLVAQLLFPPHRVPSSPRSLAAFSPSFHPASHLAIFLRPASRRASRSLPPLLLLETILRMPRRVIGLCFRWMMEELERELLRLRSFDIMVAVSNERIPKWV